MGKYILLTLIKVNLAISAKVDFRAGTLRGFSRDKPVNWSRGYNT